MFVQVITGRCTDRDAFKARMRVWDEEVRPHAEGFLGSTAGIADDGTFVISARFSSAETAQRNSDRPEQGEWWAGTEQHLEDVTFTDSTDAETFFEGGSNNSGFVQVLRGRVLDRDAFRALLKQHEPALREARPDVIGGLIVWHGDGRDLTEVIYFTSEEEARQGERTDAAQELSDALATVMEQPPSFIDLGDPMLR